MSDPRPTPEDRLAQLLAAEPYWTARAMQEQGSRFYAALGQALDAADLRNRRLLYITWPDEIWDFYERGLLLEAAESESLG
ncbi:hypothetical protein E7T06_17605 [Deinococcus sp. Arct2-2]|uniref:hypothetical protein n=1 Tax=Deinococcus sp. Arct2-2 TaxID=2568653 RepID=UPI0010A408B6|nr:hypothetical protein [Deinococcus sp. Arct2-2]THF68225.1 hypothetical protein E7T06_17605 [Deinococcus sp. Arct2-2]